MSSNNEQEMELKDVGKLRSAVNEIRVALIGLDGNNGLRGELKAFEVATEKHLSDQDEKLSAMADWKNEIEGKFDTYINHERAKTCFGLTAVKDLRVEIEKKEEARASSRRHSDVLVVELKKQRLVMFAAIFVALLSTIGTLGAAAIYANKPETTGIQVPNVMGGR